MDAFAYQEPEEEEDDDDQPEGFAVLFDENGAPVIRELDNVTPPDIKTIYAMLWSIIEHIRNPLDRTNYAIHAFA